MKKGDYITEFNGKTVSNKSQLSYLINENKEKIVTLTVKNNNITKRYLLSLCLIKMEIIC